MITFTSTASGNMRLEAERHELAQLLSLDKVTFIHQSHSADVVLVDADSPTNLAADAIVTQVKGIGVAVLSADCLPILLSSPSVVGAIHAGRVGVSNGIIANTVEVMRSLGATGIRATIGPSICGACYEVSPEMYEKYISDFPRSATSAMSHSLNLPAEAQFQLESLGVSVRNVEICTRESTRHFSYRRDGSGERFASVISL